MTPVCHPAPGHAEAAVPVGHLCVVTHTGEMGRRNTGGREGAPSVTHVIDRSRDNSSSPGGGWSPLSRRGLLRGAAALATVPVLLAADPAVAAAELPGFPAQVTLYRSAYRNWVGEITADGLWACAPAGPEQVRDVVNWA